MKTDETNSSYKLKSKYLALYNNEKNYHVSLKFKICQLLNRQKSSSFNGPSYTVQMRRSYSKTEIKMFVNFLVLLRHKNVNKTHISFHLRFSGKKQI
jgi:hypothetical protein